MSSYRCATVCCAALLVVARAALADGPKVFEEGASNRVSDAPMSVVLGDWNSDELPDYAVTLYFDNSVSIGFGLGTGTFVETSGKVGVGAFPSRIVAGDWNDDGRSDLALVNTDEGNVSILIGESGGAFRQLEKIAIGNESRDLAVGDWNGDGRADLAVVSGGDRAASLTLLLGRGNGRFTRERSMALHAKPTALVLADLNGDDALDIAVSAHSGEVSVWHNDRRGSFALARTLKTGAAPLALTSADMDGDAVIDLIAATRDGVFVHYGDGRDVEVIGATEGSPSCVAIADFDANGHLDLAVTLQDQDRLLVLAGHADRGFSEMATLVTGRAPSWVAAQDLNRDDRVDLLVTNHGGKGMTTFMNSGGRGNR